MTIDELKEFMKDEKNAEAFKELAKAVGYETPEDINGLLKKNQELILKHKKLREENETIKKTLDEIDMDEYLELKKKVESSGKASDELTKLQRDLKKISDDLEKERKARSESEGFLNRTLTENALIEALDSNGFDSKHKDLLKSAFLGKARIEMEENNRSVVLENGDGLGLPAKEFFKQFAQSENGKVYLRQPDNKGTGASGFSGTGGAKIMKRDQYEKLDPLEKSALIKDGYKLTE
jgi:regulator of replication initiation timing